ncbi:hypothetical protein D9M70_522670 [compost metagenome]
MRHHGGHTLRGAAIGNVRGLGAGDRQQKFGRKVVRGAVTAGRIHQFAGLGLQGGDQFTHRAVRAVGRHDQYVGAARQIGDGHEVLGRVVGQFREQSQVDGPGVVGAQHQGVAIRRRLDHVAHGDLAAAAGLVLDDNGLPQLLAQAGLDRPRQDVRRAAGRQRHDQGDGTIRKRRCAGRRPDERRTGQ